MSTEERNRIKDYAKQLHETGSLPFHPVSTIVGRSLADLLAAGQIYRDEFNKSTNHDEDLKSLYPDPVIPISRTPIVLNF